MPTDPPTLRCPKGGDHQWGIDGAHSNQFCKKCFVSRPCADPPAPRPDLTWTHDPPPFGVWAYSMEEGLFRIERKTETHYLEMLRVCQFNRRRLDTQTTYAVCVEGPFIYPLPDPTKGVVDHA